MANVKTYLSIILSAVYGKDVRGAIHDSIAAINTQVETTTAAESARIAAEKTRISQENARKSAEITRAAQEETRKHNETTRTAQESTRQTTFTKLRTDIDTKLKQLDQAIAGAGAVLIDPTLTKQGQAADAKAVSDQLSKVNHRLTSVIPEFQAFTLTAPSDKVVVSDMSKIKKYGKICVLSFSVTVKENTSTDGLQPLCVSPIAEDESSIGFATAIAYGDGAANYPAFIIDSVVGALIPGPVAYPLNLLGSITFISKA